MGRIYTSSVEQIAVTAIQDLFEVTVPSTGMVRILSVHIGQSNLAGDAAAEMLPIQIVRYATGGSSGALAVPAPHLVGSAASAVVVDRNNTTQGGTPTLIHADAFNVQAGWIYQPIPEEMIWIPPSGILAVELPVAPTGSTTVSASLTFEEFD